MMVTAQNLNRKIVLQRMTSVPNELNEPVETWTDFFTCHAMREDASSGEKESAGQIGAFVMSRFTIRRSSETDAIKQRDRLIHDGATWSILEKMELRDAPKRFWVLKAVRDAD